MSQAEELLNNLVEEDEITYYSDAEAHITINADRTITVPNELRSIAVQYDNNVETVTFDCPRYWDEHDFSTMHIYINYRRSDGHQGQYSVKNLVVDDADDTIIHFDWTISHDVTRASGKLSFLVCIKNLETDEMPHWNSRMNHDLIIEPGMEAYSEDLDDNPDLVETLTTRLEKLERATSFTMIDLSTGVAYDLCVINGKLMMTESEG